MVPPDLVALGDGLGWPDLPPAEIAVLSAERRSPAAAALARYVVEKAARVRSA